MKGLQFAINGLSVGVERKAIGNLHLSVYPLPDWREIRDGLNRFPV